MDDRQQKLIELAKDVIRLSKNTLLVNMRFLDAALSRLQEILDPTSDYMVTNGRCLLYDPKEVLLRYKAERTAVARDYFHVLMHCILRHMFIHTLMDREKWNLACDIAVEKSITDLNLKAVSSSREQEQSAVIAKLSQQLNLLTAEKLYRYFLDKNVPDHQLETWRNLFCVDDHSLWYISEESDPNTRSQEQKKQNTGMSDSFASNERVRSGGDSSDEQERSGGDSSDEQECLDGDSPGEQNAPRESDLADIGSEEDWKDLSERMKVDMETFGKQRGIEAGGLLQNLREVTREKYDYASFLRKFAVMNEAMKINDDEFDYIYYTYGMKLYGKVPLIEPLEYKEVKQIKEFVVAIDTSGSVVGEQVQSFVQKTFNILKTTESFATKINLHIIQCDADLQEDAKITSQEEFDAYMKTMKLHGFGGTDFRPVFAYVDKLVKNKEFSNLKGLIYFTDGYGVFPEKKPDYEAAFVFVRDEYEIPEVPPWAIKLVLDKTEV